MNRTPRSCLVLGLLPPTLLPAAQKIDLDRVTPVPADQTIPVLFIADEGHGMGNLDNQVELYGRIAAFLAKHLMPRK